jgi:hypothetical protein
VRSKLLRLQWIKSGGRHNLREDGSQNGVVGGTCRRVVGELNDSHLVFRQKDHRSGSTGHAPGVKHELRMGA